MMILLVLALVLIGVTIGAAGMRRFGQWSRRVIGPWRPGVGVLALIALFGAAALVVRGAELEAGLLAVAGVAMAVLARRRPPRTGASAGVMGVDEARRILGVGPTADQAEIEAAFRRLMQRAHPDLGGTSGLAAQLNAARDVLKR
jgi:hypothetical protein